MASYFNVNFYDMKNNFRGISIPYRINISKTRNFHNAFQFSGRQKCYISNKLEIIFSVNVYIFFLLPINLFTTWCVICVEDKCDNSSNYLCAVAKIIYSPCYKISI